MQGDRIFQHLYRVREKDIYFTKETGYLNKQNVINLIHKNSFNFT